MSCVACLVSPGRAVVVVNDMVMPIKGAPFEGLIQGFHMFLSFNRPQGPLKEQSALAMTIRPSAGHPFGTQSSNRISFAQRRKGSATSSDLP